jgi:hypothetical protein
MATFGHVRDTSRQFVVRRPPDSVRLEVAGRARTGQGTPGQASTCAPAPVGVRYAFKA